jgi:hypothetical protein
MTHLTGYVALTIVFAALGTAIVVFAKRINAQPRAGAVFIVLAGFFGLLGVYHWSEGRSGGELVATIPLESGAKVEVVSVAHAENIFEIILSKGKGDSTWTTWRLQQVDPKTNLAAKTLVLAEGPRFEKVEQGCVVFSEHLLFTRYDPRSLEATTATSCTGP